MVSKDWENIRDIIEGEELDSGLRRTLTDVLHALQMCQESVLKDLGERDLTERQSELKSWDSMWDIATVLTSRSKAQNWEDAGFFEVPFHDSLIFKNENISLDHKTEHTNAEAAFPQMTFFLKCPYDQKKDYCSEQKKFEGKCAGKPFEYRLISDPQYVQREKILERTAEAYHIHRPVIFSPYARRAVQIEVMGGVDKKKLFQAIDDDGFDSVFQLDENHLNGILLSDFILMTNFRIEENLSGDDIESQSPEEDEIYYKYGYNADENVWICPKEEADLIKLPKEHRVYALSRKEFSTLQFDRVTITPIRDRGKSVYLFRNEFDGDLMPQRIFTAGSMNLVLSAFSGVGNPSFAGLNKTKGRQVIQRYENQLGDEYGLNDELNKQSKYFQTRQRPVACILFEENEIYLSDYAEYVLSFLEEMYPEYIWTGVK